MELENLTIKKINKGLAKKEFSAAELANAYLDKIGSENDKILAYLSVSRDLALRQAAAVDEKIKKGKKIGSLAGVPMAIKDIIMVDGQKCTAASKILENYVAPYDATVVKKLKTEGAVFLGKANCDEFAMGSSNENSAFGPARNPLDPDLVPGGSSGGSAAAVAGNLCAASLGTDTGGSIRLPACFCGLAGLKPTYGAVSRYGVIAYASSLDQVGPIAKNVDDAKIVFDAIRGQDEMDATSVDFENKSAKKEKYRLGVPKEYFVKGMDPNVEKAVKDKIAELEKQGHRIVEISLPHTEYALAAYYIIVSSEASANLARYDGIRYGLSDKDAKDLAEIYGQSRANGFGAEVRRKIMLGTYVLSAGYYDAYYVRAQKVRTLIRQDFDQAFENVDAIIAPVSPTLPFAIGEKIDDPLQMYLSDIFTISINLAGVPSLAVPCGKIGRMPAGLQIIGKHFDENTLFEIGKIMEA